VNYNRESLILYGLNLDRDSVHTILHSSYFVVTKLIDVHVLTGLQGLGAMVATRAHN